MGARDEDGDGYIGLHELYRYVYERLSSEGRQIPQRSFAEGGEVVIARRPRGAPASERAPHIPDDVEPWPSPGDSVLRLSETAINLHDVQPGEVLPREYVYVRNRAGGSLEWTAETTADWIELDPHEGYFAIVLHPRPGMNRANVLVHDQISGKTRTVRVTVRVLEKSTRLRRAQAASKACSWWPRRMRTRTWLRRPLGMSLLGIGLILAVIAGVLVFRSRPPLHRPTGLALATDGTLYIADYGNYRVRRVGPDHTVATVAEGYGGQGSPWPPTAPSTSLTPATISSVGFAPTVSSPTLPVLTTQTSVATTAPLPRLSSIPLTAWPWPPTALFTLRTRTTTASAASVPMASSPPWLARVKLASAATMVLLPRPSSTPPTGSPGR